MKNKSPNLLDLLQQETSKGNTSTQERNALKDALEDYTGLKVHGSQLAQVLETDDGNLNFFVFPSAPFNNSMFHLILSTGINHQGRIHLCADITGYDELTKQKMENLKAVANSFQSRHKRPPLQFQQVSIEGKPRDLLEIDSEIFDVIAPKIDQRNTDLDGKRSNWITALLWVLTLIPLAWDGAKYFFKKKKKAKTPVKKNPIRRNNSQKDLFENFVSSINDWNRSIGSKKESVESIKSEFEKKKHILNKSKVLLGDKI